MVEVESKPWFEIVENMDNDDYRAYPAISKSDLDKINRSIAHWKAPNSSPTPEMKEGSAFHCYVLEPWHFKNRYKEAPKLTKNSAAETKWFGAIENKGFLPITKEQLSRFECMADNLWSHPKASRLLKPLNPESVEVSYFWETEVYIKDSLRSGSFHTIKSKCRVDHTNAYENVLIDLKTTQDGSKNNFPMSVAKYRYHVQAAWYREGFFRTHEVEEYPEFAFICVEKKAPFNVSVLTLGERSLAQGSLEAKADLAEYAFWLNEPEDQRVEGYSVDIQEIELPNWAFKEN